MFYYVTGEKGLEGDNEHRELRNTYDRTEDGVRILLERVLGQRDG